MDNSIIPSSPSSHTCRSRDILLLLALSALLLLIGLGDLGLTDRDEGSNAEAAREMLETGDWISPTLNYEPRYAKPAFVYWIISASYAVFGVNEFAARLPSAMFGMALILLHYGFLARVCGASVALFGGLILLLNLEVIGISRMVLTDPELVFFTTLAGYSFWLGLEGKDEQRWAFWGFYVGMGFAMLAKGPVGIIIPLLVVIPYLSVMGEWRRFWQEGYPILGTIVLILLAAPWYAAMFSIHGADYLAAAQKNTTGRFANPMEGHGGTIFFYIPVLLLGFFPWSAFLPGTLCRGFKDWRLWRAGEQGLSKEQRLVIFSGLWIVGILIFFTLSATRLPHYIFPLYPAAAILVALFFKRCLEEDSVSGLRMSIAILLVFGYVLGLALASGPAIYEAFVGKMTKEFPAAGQLDVGLVPVIIGVIVVVGTMITRYFLNSAQKREYGFWTACGMMVLFVLFVVLGGLPKFNTYFVSPPQELASIAGLNLQENDRLIQFGRKRPSLAFYSQRKVYQINPGQDEKFEEHVNASGRKMIVLQSHLRSKLPESVRDYSVVLERRGFSLLASESLLH